MAAYKVAALEKSLDESVSLSELERANKEYTELTVKYRDVLQRDSLLIQRTNNLEHLEVLKDMKCPRFLISIGPLQLIKLGCFFCHSE